MQVHVKQYDARAKEWTHVDPPRQAEVVAWHSHWITNPNTGDGWPETYATVCYLDTGEFEDVNHWRLAAQPDTAGSSEDA